MKKRIIAPPSLNFENKQNPSPQLTRQIIYDYLEPLSLEQLQKLQEQCSFCQAKAALILKGDTMFKNIHGILCFQKTHQPLKIVMPEEIALEVVTKFHTYNKLMHSSKEKMGIILKNVFLFKNFDTTAKQIIKNCTFCQQNKPARVGDVPIFPNKLQFFPRKNISIDLVHISANLENVILTVIDLFTNFVIFIPVKKGYTSITIARTIVERIFSFIGTASVIITDNEKSLISPLLVNIAMLLNCQHFSIVPRQSTTQGSVECYNKLLLKAFRYFKTITQITDENIGTLCALAGHFMNSVKSPKMIKSPYFLCLDVNPLTT